MTKQIVIIKERDTSLNVDFNLPEVTGNKSFTCTNLTTGYGDKSYVWEVLTGSTVIYSATTQDLTYTFTEYFDNASIKLTATTKYNSGNKTKSIGTNFKVDMTLEYYSICTNDWVTDASSYIIFSRTHTFQFRIKEELAGVTYHKQICIDKYNCSSGSYTNMYSVDADFSGNQSISYGTTTPGTDIATFTSGGTGVGFRITNNKTSSYNNDFQGVAEVTEMHFDSTNAVSINSTNYGPNSSVVDTFTEGTLYFSMNSEYGNCLEQSCNGCYSSYRVTIYNPDGTLYTQSTWRCSLPVTVSMSYVNSNSYKYVAEMRTTGGSTQTNTMYFKLKSA